MMIVGAAGGSVADKPAAPTRASTCVSKVHLRPVSEHATKITWWKKTVDTARVEAWTCPACDDDQYELCTLGGVSFIRRTSRSHSTHETLRDTPDATRRVWELLVAGGAR